MRNLSSEEPIVDEIGVKDVLALTQPLRAREAWMIFTDCHENGLRTAMVGPGETPITLSSVTIDPHRYQVFDATGSGFERAGEPLERLHALALAKSLHRRHRCPLLLSSGEDEYRLWDSTHVTVDTLGEEH